MTQPATALYEDIFKAHERFLWGLCYRLTGNAADADDIVQETFIRAMKSPPARTDEPWRPWLVRVAMNLGRDLLRQRKRRGYEGQWLPSPIETGDDFVPPSYEPMSDEEGNPAARYDLMESVSFAFLLALEALTPAQRAVLLLRDVFDYSVQETAEALGMSEANVKTTHHRARRAMQDYDHQRQPLTRTLQARTLQAMQKFLHCLYSHDVAGAAALLAEDVRHVSDAGGEFHAARVPVVGRDKVMLFLTNTVLRRGRVAPLFEWREMNGGPALIVEQPQADKSLANRWVTICELNEQGQIKTINNVLATRKLSRVRPLAQSKQ